MVVYGSINHLFKSLSTVCIYTGSYLPYGIGSYILAVVCDDAVVYSFMNNILNTLQSVKKDEHDINKNQMVLSQQS